MTPGIDRHIRILEIEYNNTPDCIRGDYNCTECSYEDECYANIKSRAKLEAKIDSLTRKKMRKIGNGEII